MVEEDRRRLLSATDSGQFGSHDNGGVQAVSAAPDNSMEGTKDVINFDKALNRAGGLGNYFLFSICST